MTPPALLAALRHHDSLHEHVVVLTVVTADRPKVHPMERAEITDLGLGFRQVVLRFGFMEDPDVPAALAGPVARDVGIDLDAVTYVVGRQSLRSTPRPGMARWRERLFAAMSRNATAAADYFHLPTDQVIELGLVLDL